MARARYRNRECWRRFKATAGIDSRITLQKAYRLTAMLPLNFARIINGRSDCKVSMVARLAKALGCSMQGICEALIESWGFANRIADTQMAIDEAKRQRELDRIGDGA